MRSKKPTRKPPSKRGVSIIKPKRDKSGRFVSTGKSKRKRRPKFDPLDIIQAIADDFPIEVSDYGYDTNGDRFNQTWDEYQVEIEEPADIDAHSIRKLFSIFKRHLAKHYGRKPTILKVRVGILTEQGRQVTPTWVTVSATTAFGSAFTQIVYNVTKWLIGSNYATFDGLLVRCQRGQKKN